MEVDNLEKFAKTSHTAEVVLERLKSSQKKQSERHEVSGKSDDNSASSSRTRNLAYADFVLDPKLPA
jgi:hypothetical protein